MIRLIRLLTNKGSIGDRLFLRIKDKSKAMGSRLLISMMVKNMWSLEMRKWKFKILAMPNTVTMFWERETN